MRESNFSAATRTAPFGPSLIRTSTSGRARTISYSFFAGTVSAPSRATAAAQRLRNPTSRSVASSRTPSLPSVSMSTFARIGMVFLRSTIPWNSCSSCSRSDLRTVISMRLVTSAEGVVHSNPSREKL